MFSSFPLAFASFYFSEPLFFPEHILPLVLLQQHSLAFPSAPTEGKVCILTSGTYSVSVDAELLTEGKKKVTWTLSLLTLRSLHATPNVHEEHGFHLPPWASAWIWKNPGDAGAETTAIPSSPRADLTPFLSTQIMLHKNVLPSGLCPNSAGDCEAG